MAEKILKNIGLTDSVTITQYTFFQSIGNFIWSTGKYGIIIGLSMVLGGLAVAGVDIQQKIVPKVIEAVTGIEQTVEQKINSADPGAVKEIAEGGEKIIEGVGSIVTGSPINSAPQMGVSSPNAQAMPMGIGGNPQGMPGMPTGLEPSAPQMPGMQGMPIATPVMPGTPVMQGIPTGTYVGGSKKTKTKRKGKRTRSKKYANKSQTKKCLVSKGDKLYLNFCI
jgi:hypothetical protein